MSFDITRITRTLSQKDSNRENAILMRPQPTIFRAALLGAAAFLLTGCSSGTSSGGPNDADATAQATEVAITIPVGSPFGESQWSATIDAAPDQAPLVLGSHVVALSGGQVIAWNADGDEAWQVPVPDMGGDSTVALRQIDATTVAVVVTGETEGEGLNKSGYASQIALINISSGETSVVDLAGSDVRSPILGKIGVSFILPDGTGAVIASDGKTVKVPDIATTTGSPNNSEVEDPLISLGQTVIWSTAEGSEEGTGYATDTWSTGDLKLLPYTWSSTIEAVAPAQGIVVVGAHTDDHEYAAVDAKTGRVLSNVDCKPSYLMQPVTSPNGEFSVVGPLLVSANNVQCVGGGEGEQNVDLTAVSDDGRAFGSASEGELVVIPADGGEPETSDLPEGANPPIGILDSGLAVHFDSQRGVVTANPVK